jgi:uncharacterized coiled-coil protein SlyX
METTMKTHRQQLVEKLETHVDPQGGQNDVARIHELLLFADVLDERAVNVGEDIAELRRLLKYARKVHDRGTDPPDRSVLMEGALLGAVEILSKMVTNEGNGQPVSKAEKLPGRTDDLAETFATWIVTERARRGDFESFNSLRESVRYALAQLASVSPEWPSDDVITTYAYDIGNADGVMNQGAAGKRVADMLRSRFGPLLAAQNATIEYYNGTVGQYDKLRETLALLGLPTGHHDELRKAIEAKNAEIERLQGVVRLQNKMAEDHASRGVYEAHVADLEKRATDAEREWHAETKRRVEAETARNRHMFTLKQIEACLEEKNQRIARLETELLESKKREADHYRCYEHQREVSIAAINAINPQSITVEHAIGCLTKQRAEAAARIASLEKQLADQEPKVKEWQGAMAEIREAVTNNGGLRDALNALNVPAWRVGEEPVLVDVIRKACEALSEVAIMNAEMTTINETLKPLGLPGPSVSAAVKQLVARLAPMSVDGKTPGEVSTEARRWATLMRGVPFSQGWDVYDGKSVDIRVIEEEAAQAVLRSFGVRMVKDALVKLHDQLTIEIDPTGCVRSIIEKELATLTPAPKQ